MISAKLIPKNGPRDLYRALIRLTLKLDSSILTSPNLDSKRLLNEKLKYNLDQELYLNHIRSEIKYHIRQEYTKQHKSFEAILSAYIKGLETISSFQNFDETLKCLINYRDNAFAEQNLYSDPNKKTDPPKVPHEIIKPKSMAAQHKAFKLNLQKAQDNTDQVLHRYIKRKQLLGELPVPHRLPYTPEVDYTLDKDPIFGIPKSIHPKSINSAYSQKYINAIIKPSLAYDINKKFYFGKLEKIVNEKGPVNVKVNITNAGPIPVPYIKLPYPRLTELKEVAMDIKKMMTLFRLYYSWLEKSKSAEKTFSDGSFSIKKCGGFGRDEIIYPASYYYNLAEGEASWEHLMKDKNDHTSFEQTLSSWTEFVDISTDDLALRVQSYRDKYSHLMRKGSPIFQDQKILQEQQNKHFDKQLAIYSTILNDLKLNKVHKHSEIVNSDTNTTRYSNDEVYGRVARDGIPRYERYGMGKTLGDTLKLGGYKSFEFGRKFSKRF